MDLGSYQDIGHNVGFVSQIKSTETKKRDKQESLPVLLPGGGYYRKYDLHVNQPHSLVWLADMYEN